MFNVHPYLGKWLNLTNNIFQTGWNHHLLEGATTISQRFLHVWCGPGLGERRSCLPSWAARSEILEAGFVYSFLTEKRWIGCDFWIKWCNIVNHVYRSILLIEMFKWMLVFYQNMLPKLRSHDWYWSWHIWSYLHVLYSIHSQSQTKKIADWHVF